MSLFSEIVIRRFLLCVVILVAMPILFIPFNSFQEQEHFKCNKFPKFIHIISITQYIRRSSAHTRMLENFECQNAS